MPGIPVRWRGPLRSRAEVAELRGCVRRPIVAVFRIGMEVGERLERMHHNRALQAAANRPQHLRPVKYVQPRPCG